MTNQKDDYYIQQVLEGQVNAFAHLVEKYKDMVFTLALKILKDREQAEETAQDVFVKSYQSLSEFKGKSKFATWLYSITYNACMDVVKRRKKYIIPEDIALTQDAHMVVEDNAIGILIQKDRNMAVENAIAKLRKEDQIIIWLYYFEEMPLKDIAKIVHLSVSNVKVKLHRSRKQLYSLLKYDAVIRE